MGIVELDDESRRLVETALILTAAAGGKIVVTRSCVEQLGAVRLVVTEDAAKGTKTYEIVRDDGTE